MKAKLVRYKKIVSIVLSISLIAQCLLLFGIDSVSKNLQNQYSDLNNLKVNLQTTFMTDTIREQQRTMLNTIRQGWIQYTQSHPEEQLILKDFNGLTIYGGIDSISTISFNPKTMTKIKKPSNYYDIMDNSTGKRLATDVRPLWNIEVVKTILNITATPVKAFGGTGDVIIFDSFTGQMIIDNSEDCKDSPDVLGNDGKRYITLDDKHKNNKNPLMTKRVVDEQMMWRHDTDRATGMIYYFNEPSNFNGEPNNFEKYPLGDFNREFQEKIILPYESVGVNGESMQITIVSGAQESEIIAPYREEISHYNKSLTTIKLNAEKVSLYPYISIIINFVVIFLCMFIITVYSSHAKK